jgi:hypothetical protein
MMTLAVRTASATSLGFNTDPADSAWDRLQAGTGFAFWDSFPSMTYTGLAPTVGNTFGITSAVASQTNSNFGVTNQGVGLYNVLQSTPAPGNINGDIFFAGGNAASFALGGSVSFTIYGVVLQVKRPSSTGTLADASGFTPTLIIDGGASIPADGNYFVSGSGDTSSDAGTYSVTTWYWGASLASLANTGNSTFSVNFGRSPLQRGIDGFSVDVGSTAVVPEPSTAVSLLGGLGLLVTLRRRTRRTV